MSQPISFTDSNIWLYSLMTEAATPEDMRKQQAASTLLRQIRPTISTQVINETCSVLIRKARFDEVQTNDHQSLCLACIRSQIGKVTLLQTFPFDENHELVAIVPAPLQGVIRIGGK
jgi:predicted nucleic acid-binding protein